MAHLNVFLLFYLNIIKATFRSGYAPIQMRILTITDDQMPYANALLQSLRPRATALSWMNHQIKFPQK